MSEAYNKTRELEVILTRIDWVLSGDDSEETYLIQRLNDLAKIEYDDPLKDEEWLKDYENGS